MKKRSEEWKFEIVREREKERKEVIDTKVLGCGLQRAHRQVLMEIMFRSHLVSLFAISHFYKKARS